MVDGWWVGILWLVVGGWGTGNGERGTGKIINN